MIILNIKCLIIIEKDIYSVQASDDVVYILIGGPSRRTKPRSAEVCTQIFRGHLVSVRTPGELALLDANLTQAEGLPLDQSFEIWLADKTNVAHDWLFNMSADTIQDDGKIC